MAVYAIISEHTKPALLANITRAYSGKTYQFSDRTVFVSTPDTPQQIAAKIGVQHRTPDRTVVDGLTDVTITKVAPVYYGWTNSAFWDWLKSAHQEDGA